MSEKQTFSSLRVWQSAHEFAIKMYELANTLPKDEHYSLGAQLKRCSAQVSGYLAEGYGRYYHKEKARIYLLARGSIAQAQNLLYLAKDLKLIDEGIALLHIDAYDGLSRGISVLASKISQPKATSAEESQPAVPIVN